MAPQKPKESDVLTQNDVESLLAEIAQQEASTTTIHCARGDRNKSFCDSVQPYDFRHPMFLAANDLRRLRIEHDEFISSLAARLSIYLRLEFTLQMSKLQTVTYQKFTEGIDNPAHLTLFKIEPLRGIGILDINPRLGLTTVDRQMGGPGHSVKLNRDLSDIETALLDQVVQIIIGEWCSHWSDMVDLRPVILGHENSGVFLQTAAPDTVMLVLLMEARLGDCLEQIQLAFPYSTIEPLVRRLNQKLVPEGEENQISGKAPSWNPELEDVMIPVVAEFPPLRLTNRDLTQLQVGDVLELDPELSAEVQVRLASLPKFAGRLGSSGRKWAVEITRVLSNQPIVPNHEHRR